MNNVLNIQEESLEISSDSSSTIVLKGFTSENVSKGHIVS